MMRDDCARGTCTLALLATDAISNVSCIHLAIDDEIHARGTRGLAIARADAAVEIDLDPSRSDFPMLDARAIHVSNLDCAVIKPILLNQNIANQDAMHDRDKRNFFIDPCAISHCNCRPFAREM